MKDYVDHWEISRTFKTFNNSSLDIDTVGNEYRVINGHNQVLIVTIERKPIFNKGKELTDLYSIKSLLIELDSADELVTSEKPFKSKLFRKIVAFSPKHGIKALPPEDKITAKRRDINIWTFNSIINDFVFNADLDFETNQILTDKFNDY